MCPVRLYTFRSAALACVTSVTLHRNVWSTRFAVARFCFCILSFNSFEPAIRRRAVISLGTPRLNFLCRSTQEELEREYKPLRTTHVTGYGRCEQLFTLFFAYQ